MTQRVGSTWLCDILTRTGISGKPGEHLNFPDTASVFKHYGSSDPNEVLEKILAIGSTDNGVFGIKQGYCQPGFAEILSAIGTPAKRACGSTAVSTWENAFPHHRHIVMTRRNKLRLAVSWWKAIKTGEYHRKKGQKPSTTELLDAYDANSLRHLLTEAVAREAGIAEMLSGARISPLTIVYEDLVLETQRELDRIHRFLDLPAVTTSSTDYAVTADELSETWVQRFRQDLQEGWSNVGW